MIFGKEIILKLIKQKIIEIKNLDKNNINPFSIDFKIEKIFKLEVKTKKIIEINCEKGVILDKNEIYFIEPIEKIIINDERIFFNIFSKSSTARIGLNLNDEPIEKFIRDENNNVLTIDTTLPNYKNKNNDYLFRIQNYGTKIKLKKNDIVGQIIFSDNPGELFGSYNKERKYITLDNEILIYDGKTILEIGKDNSKAFKLIKLSEKETLTILAKTFFLGLSQEEFAIPNNKIGFLINFPQGDNNFTQNFKFQAHPSCPLIGNKSIFQGKITFEFFTLKDTIIKKGEIISIINYIGAAGVSKEKSSYYNQNLRL